MPKIELIPYISNTGSFQIFYPKDFHIEEDDDGIVTITSPESYSNLTLSGYKASLDVDEKVLTKFFQEFTEDYTPLSQISKEITIQRLLLECAFKRDRTNWIWWAMAEANQVVMISVNSEDELSKEDYNLYRYMINQMEIYPSAFED